MNALTITATSKMYLISPFRGRSFAPLSLKYLLDSCAHQCTVYLCSPSMLAWKTGNHCQASKTYSLSAELSDELADCAIQRFSEANFSRINNKNGFLMGIIRRVKTDGPDRSSGDLESLPRPLRYKLQDLIDDVRHQYFWHHLHIFTSMFSLWLKLLLFVMFLSL